MSNYSTSTIKITNHQNDMPINGNGYTSNKSTKIYINPNDQFNSLQSSGYSSYNNGRDSAQTHGERKTSIRFGDYKEDYDPDYRKNDNIYWRDLEKEARLKKDFYINHKKMSEEEYNQYLDKENIREKSILTRISNEEDIRDKARQYYDQNKTTKKVNRTVSEIFSKKPSVGSYNSLSREVTRNDGPSSISTMPRLSSLSTYAPVYKSKYSSHSRTNSISSPDNSLDVTRDEPVKSYDVWGKSKNEELNKPTSPKKDTAQPLYLSNPLAKYSEQTYAADDRKLKIDNDLHSIESQRAHYPSKSSYQPLKSTKYSDYRSPFTPNRMASGFDFNEQQDEVFLPATKVTLPRLQVCPAKKTSFSDDQYYSPPPITPKVEGSTKSFSNVESHTKSYSNNYHDEGTQRSSVSSSKLYTPTITASKINYGVTSSNNDKTWQSTEQVAAFDVPSTNDKEKDARNVALMNKYYDENKVNHDDYNGPAPSRFKWIPNKKGVIIKDIVDGQPCDDCNDKCTGFSPHPWRKTCQFCKCPRESHAIYQEEYADVRSRLGFVAPSHWAPPGLPPVKADKFLRATGAGNVADRAKRLAKQLPRQDLAAAHCRHLDPKHKASFEDFISARNEIALDIGYAKENVGPAVDCPTCHEPVKYEDLGVVATRLGDDVMYHPQCFVCTTCEELLADLAYCALDERPYCERHYAEMLKPRCSACDEVRLYF